MKRNFNAVLLVLLLISSGCNTLQKGTSSDIVILPLGGEVKVTEGSIVYALPQTVFVFDITARKTIEVPGPYARFAGEMLGLNDVITEENESWSLGDVSVSCVEELDPSQFYIIQGTTLMQTNLLALKKNGLVLDINPDIYSETNSVDNQGGSDASGLHVSRYGGTGICLNQSQTRHTGLYMPIRYLSGYLTSLRRKRE